MHLVGVHCHIGSNVFAADSFARAAEVMAAFAIPLDLPELVLGGGLGVPYVGGEEAPTITEWGRVLSDACRAAAPLTPRWPRLMPGASARPPG